MAAASVLAAASVHAAEFPQRPITMVVPYAPGGTSDGLGRLLARQLSQQLGQSVVVENKPGAGSTIGTEFAAKAASDGYTVLLADNAQTTAQFLYPRLPYDGVDSFRAIGMAGFTPALLFSSTKADVRSLKDMAAHQAKASAPLSIGVGLGTASHLFAEQFQMKSGQKLQVVGYKGAGQAMADLLGGQIDLVFAAASSASAHVKAGRVVPIGVTGAQRHPSFPDVPTFKEQGVDGLDKVTYWFGLVMPAGAAEALARRWEREFAAALASSEVSRTLAELGITKAGMTAEQMQRFLAEDKALWENVIRTSGVKLQ